MRKKTLDKALGALALLAFAGPAAGDLKSDLTSFFNDAAYSNVTQPGVYEGQTAGMLTGGGISYRVPSRTYNLLSLQTPRLRAGCGGIDLFTGGFSFVNADQLVAMLQNIGANAQAYAYQLALRIISAQIASTLGEAFDWAQKYLNQSVNSCEAAQQLVGGAFQAIAGAEHGCILRRLDAGESWGQAKVACGAGAANDAAPASVREHLPFFKGNLAWMALMKNPGFAADAQLAQVAMTLTGTLIRRPDPGKDGPGQMQVVPPMLETSEGARLVDAILYGPAAKSGGAVSYWRCMDGTGADQCLSLNKATVTFDANSALVPKVRQQLVTMADKIARDEPPTLEQHNLLMATSLPVYKYLTVAVASGNATLAYSESAHYAEFIARDILYTYLRDLVGEVSGAVSQQRLNNEDGSVIAFRQQIASAHRELDNMKEIVKQRYEQQMKFTEQMLLYQRMVASRVPASAFDPYKLAKTVGAAK